MKKINLILILMSLLINKKVLAHKEWVHQYITKQGYLFLEDQVGIIPDLKDAIGLTYHGVGDVNNPWLSTYPIGVGTWREDIDDPVYGYNTYNAGTASVTHFWKADQGDEAWSDISADIFDVGTKSGTYENAWQKARIYLFGGHKLILKGRIPYMDPYHFATDYVISYSSLVDLYAGNYTLYSFRDVNSGNIWTYTTPLQVKNSIFRKQFAYQILGRTAHLLQDMSVPAHAHVHAHPCPLYYPDYYENSMGYVWPRQGLAEPGDHSCEDDPASYGFSTNDYPAVNWTYKTAKNQGGLIDNIPCRNSMEVIRYMFYTLNQLADFFPSGTNTSGEGSSSYSKQTYMSGNNLLPQGSNDYLAQRYEALGKIYSASNNLPSRIVVNDIAEETFNYSIRATASLFYWFALQTGQIGNTIPPSLALAPMVVSQTLPSHKAGYITTANNTVSIEAGGSVNFIATDYIQLLPGFIAKGSSVFHSFITTCESARKIARLAKPMVKTTIAFEELNINAPKTITYNTDKISGTDKISINIYPIPASNQLSVSFSGSVNEISLLDMQGKCLKNIFVQEGKDNLSINTEDLAAGLYFLQLKNATSVERKKIVIVHNQ